jgi:hypothetical protein
MSRYLLVIDVRDDFDRIAKGLRHYEAASPDATFVVLVPEQEDGYQAILPLDRRVESARTAELLNAMKANGVSVERVFIDVRDVVTAVAAQVERTEFDEIIVASPPVRLERFFGEDFSHRLQRAFDVKVVSLVDPKAHELETTDFWVE